MGLCYGKLLILKKKTLVCDLCIEICENMKNSFLPQKAIIISVKKENDLINCFRLKFDTKIQKDFQFIAGQFLMVGLPGYGDAPFTLSSDARKSQDYFEICVRTAGELSEKINSLKKGDSLYIRGPFGNGFPDVKSNLIIVGGGCGFIPLKSIILENMNRSDIKIQTFMGCRSRNTIVFESELSKWKEKFDLKVILEDSPYVGFSSEKGFVTDLISQANLLPESVVFCCGPEPMYKFVAKVLNERGITSNKIYFSLERRMYCGTGQCQHCVCGPVYTCKDGPVFTHEYLKGLGKEHIDI